MNYSFSSLSTFNQCSLKFYFQYVLKIEFIEQNIAAFLGSVCHEVFETYYKENGSLTRSDLKQKFYDLFDLGMITENIIVKKDSDIGFNRFQGSTIVEEFYNNVDISKATPAEYIDSDGVIQPFVEVKTKIPVINLKTKLPIGEDLTITAILDIVENHHGKLKVKDHKTASREYEDFFVDTSLQLTMYAYVLRYLIVLGKVAPIPSSKKEIAVGFNMFLKNRGKASSKVIEKKITEDDLTTFYNTITNIDKCVKQEIFIPAFNDACNAFGGCQYRDICLLYNKNKEPFKDGKLIDKNMLLKKFPGKVAIREPIILAT